MAVPILLLLSEHSLFSVEECISPLNTSIFYTYVVSHHFCFPHNLGNLLSIRIYDISISVDLAHSWHFKCMTYIDQALPEVHINLQEIHGAIIHRENLPLPPKKSYICISFPTQGESCKYKDYLVNYLANPPKPNSAVSQHMQKTVQERSDYMGFSSAA